MSKFKVSARYTKAPAIRKRYDYPIFTKLYTPARLFEERCGGMAQTKQNGVKLLIDNLDAMSFRFHNEVKAARPNLILQPEILQSLTYNECLEKILGFALNSNGGLVGSVPTMQDNRNINEFWGVDFGTLADVAVSRREYAQQLLNTPSKDA